MNLLSSAALAGLGRAIETAIFLVIVVAIELAIPRQRYSLASRLRGFGYWLLWALAAGATNVGLQRLWLATGVRPFLTLHVDRWLAWSGPLALILGPLIALMALDFAGYWFHRIQHGLLWRFHAVHHSIEDLNAVNSYGHITDEFFRVLIVVIPMSLFPLTGIVQPAIITAAIALFVPYIHSPVRMHFGPLQRVFVDNRFHRIHHSTDPAHFNRNFGVYFTLWDQVFGTAYFPKPDEWPATGLADLREPRTVGEWLDAPFRMGRPRVAVADQVTR